MDNGEAKSDSLEDNEISGRKLGPIYLAAILGTMLESAPAECSIDLDKLIPQDLPNYSGFSFFTDKSLSHTPEYKEAEAKEKAYYKRCDERKHKLAIARGTLIYALKLDLINSPEGQNFINTPNRFYLANCTLGVKAMEGIFKQTSESDAALIKKIAKDIGIDDDGRKDTPWLLKAIAGYAKGMITDQIKDETREGLKTLLAFAGPTIWGVISNIA